MKSTEIMDYVLSSAAKERSNVIKELQKIEHDRSLLPKCRQRRRDILDNKNVDGCPGLMSEE